MTDTLERAVAALAQAESLPEVQRIVRTAARQLARAQGATLVLRQGGHCYYADEDAISPLWKGQRFPIGDCISGWTMRHGRPAVVPDIRVDDRIPQRAYRPTFVRSLAMVPVPPGDPAGAVGAIGAYWSQVRRATGAEVDRLCVLAEATAPALARFPAPVTRPTAGYEVAPLAIELARRR